MPMGERPSARITRRSQRPPAPTAANEDVNPIAAAPPVVGEIMEHQKKKGTIKLSCGDSTKKQSRFKQQSGFPSVKLPLGTFVKPKPRAAPVVTNKKPAKANVPNNKLQLDMESLRQTSARDADGMLQGMSRSEIHDHVQELEGSLSPEALAFLRERRKKKTETEKAIAVVPQNQSSSEKEKIKEKERIAHVLAGIKTYEELDEVYARERPEEVIEEDESSDDFVIACDLLRSTVPRQNLWAARTVYHRLAGDLQAYRHDRCCKRSYPSLLIVSLRCLLDTPLQRVNGYVLHTYVLQSMNILLQLTACPEHAVDVSGEYGDGLIHQEYFLQDSVPSPRIEDCYRAQTVSQAIPVPGADSAAYATGSSSESAETDAKAFQRDPLWTMLSKLRILPRFASFDFRFLPKEALKAMAGILAMISQRSAGAASAMVQHPTLLCRLHQTTLVPKEGQAECDADLALSTIILYTTLARQSRVAAEGLDLGFLVQVLVARDLENPAKIKVQRWALILWRTVLRYSIGLELLSDLLCLAATSITTVSSPLAPDYISSLAAVQRCVWVANLEETPQRKGKVNPEKREILGRCSDWMASSIRQAVLQLESVMKDEVRCDAESVTSAFRLCAACMELLDVTINLKEPSFDMLPLEGLLEAGAEGNVVKKAIKVLIPSMLDIDCDKTSSRESCELEASAGVFMTGFVRILRTVDTLKPAHPKSMCLARGLQMATQVLFEEEIDSHERRFLQHASMSRRAWLNRSHCAILSFLLSDPAGNRNGIEQQLAFALIGRLQCGEESLAITILSNEDVFCANTNPVSNVLLQELCGSHRSRAQVDHSFKRHSGLGFTVDEAGPFELLSLTSEVPLSGSENLLPLGSLWLWQLLSVANQETSFWGDVFRLIRKIEVGFGYCQRIPAGAKMFFLLNTCAILDDVVEDIQPRRIFVELVHLYCASTGSFFGASFCKACANHSTRTTSEQESDSVADDIVAKSILEAPEVPHSNVPVESMRAVLDYQVALCDQFVDDGARGSCTAMCLRLLLFPTFPDKIRSGVLHRLNGLLHLLSIENDDVPAMMESFLCRGKRSADPLMSTFRETPTFLNEVTSIIRADSGMRLGPGGFFYNIVMVSLTSQMATSLLVGDEGAWAAASRRFFLLPSSIQTHVIASLTKFSETSMSCSDMVSAIVSSATTLTSFMPPSGESSWSSELANLEALLHRNV